MTEVTLWGISPHKIACSWLFSTLHTVYSVKMNTKYQLVVSFVAVVYIILGGVIFHYIEKEDEEKARREAAERNWKWLSKRKVK